MGRNIGSVPMYFNPRSPDGERPSPPGISPKPERFQSTLPGWGATKESHQYSPLCEISIHAPRMGSDRNESACPQSQEISIHAPRMGSDVACGLTLMVPVVFQSTLPGWGATVLRRYEPVRLSGFQSTLPGWGATRYEDIMTVSGFNFNPRSPDGERLVDCSLPPRNSTISIHAPRMGSDASNSPCWFRCQEFQSTLPGWGATQSIVNQSI